MNLLEVRNVTKIYRTESEQVAALQNVSFLLRAGDFVALVGKSGGGKSTLLNLCGAMDFPTKGEIELDGCITSKLADAELTRLRREKVGFIFQSFQLIHTLSAAENVELPLLLARRRDARQIAMDRLAWVEMAQYSQRFPHQLSGGQQQRIAIARALVNDPKLLLADEPTGNLDTATGEIVLNLLSRAARQFGVAVMMATHSVESTSAVDRIIQLRDGRLAEAVVTR
ncbi:MAG: ABC transporter ATP-binding protein [Acidobacteriota bacterium]|nr:ABC transporter ATP-binding protein [Acidobacteriota bacterium]